MSVEVAQPEVKATASEMTAPVTPDPAKPLTETPGTEGAKTEEKPAVKAEEKVEEKPKRKSDTFAAIAREEKRIREERKKFQAEKEKYKPYVGMEEKIKSNPLEFLSQFGLTYNDLTKLVLNDQKKTPEMEIKAVQEEIERMKTERVDSEKKAQQDTVHRARQTFLGEIGSHLETNSETYELTKTHPEGAALVYNVIEKYFTDNDRILSTDEACKAVEDYLEKEIEKYSNLKKIQNKFKPKETEKPKEEVKSTGTHTLTNAQQTEVPTPVEKPWSYQDSLARAAKLIKWNTE